jgi:hypothetical protein
MKRTEAKAPSAREVEKQVKNFIDKFEPHHQKLIREVRKTLRKRLPTANELVYDNYNFFVIGYGASERPSDCILSIAAAASGVGLCFLYGASLPDPKKVLTGSGNQTRFLRLPTANVLSLPEVEALIAAAVRKSKAPFSEDGRRKLIIRSISAKQRPRRK